MLRAGDGTVGKLQLPGLCVAGLWECPLFFSGFRLSLIWSHQEGERGREDPPAGEGGGLPGGTPALLPLNLLGS